GDGIRDGHVTGVQTCALPISGEAAAFPPHLVPHVATLDQYRQLFVRLNLGRAFFSSAFVAIVVTISSVLFGSMAGYAFAKLRFEIGRASCRERGEICGGDVAR